MAQWKMHGNSIQIPNVLNDTVLPHIRAVTSQSECRSLNFSRFDMKRLCGLPLLLLCLMLSTGSGASANDSISGFSPIPLAPAQDDPFAAVDACLQQEMSRRNMPGASMAIAIEGELAHASAFGYRRRDAPGRVDTETIFRLVDRVRSQLRQTWLHA